MNRLILFIKYIYVFLLFVILEIAALNYYTKSSPYAKAKVLIASNKVTGKAHEGVSGIINYFGLRGENRKLVDQIAQLNQQIYQSTSQDPSSIPIVHDSTFLITQKSVENYSELYLFSSATVINNSITNQKNYITINRGSKDGIERNMALITPEGSIVGYVLESSHNYSVAISALNNDFRTGGKFKDKDFFGSISWRGYDHTRVTLSEVPKYANIIIGDTIVTGYSSIFPPNIMIGVVENYQLTPSTYYEVSVKLSTSFSRLRDVLIVDYANMQERELLENRYLDQGVDQGVE